jgi:hypothetical protein
MTLANPKATLVSALAARFPASFHIRQPAPPVTLATGIPGLELPRGAITEICGATSSGRTSLLLAVLATATSAGEVCALVDTSDAFDPASAAEAGVGLDSLLWIRCLADPVRAIQAADLLLLGGGFGLVVLDLADVPTRLARRIPLTSWFRFRRAIENTPTALIVLEREPHAKSCAALLLEMSRRAVHWSGSPNARLLRGFSLHAVPRKPTSASSATFQASGFWLPASGF